MCEINSCVGYSYVLWALNASKMHLRSGLAAQQIHSNPKSIAIHNKLYNKHALKSEGLQLIHILTGPDCTACCTTCCPTNRSSGVWVNNKPTKALRNLRPDAIQVGYSGRPISGGQRFALSCKSDGKSSQVDSTRSYIYNEHTQVITISVVD